ncbi:putative disease resistance protein RGA3 [Vitis vinifera]|uniref:Putative disease resistance protein RGA3 n=1 Tax=Vitis vinifera TaxID=29760 RepID=A0A438BVV2_VITVI|nr:putative disease resistance protein RGA3 [Vitis vinifera]
MITEMILREEEPTETNVSVISIVGMGGVGKTTLALMVYNDEETAKKFSLKAWVCVSNQYDMVRITKTILEAVTSHSSNLQDFNQIQRALSETLRGKRFLIVLDDLWNEDYGDWNCLRSPFWAGGKGSKIIVTTRCKGVATMMGGEKNLYELKHLSYEDCWLVFEKHAFENRTKALGGLLRTKLEEEEWENILNSKVWNLQGEKCGNIIPTLRLSYNHLPSHLKRCFAYCAIFPKNYEFMEKELILLWMAKGRLEEMPTQVGKLKSLQVLSNFMVGKNNNLEIKELRNMPHLQGEICISNVENVMNIQDAKNANLHLKHKLEWLTVKWSAKLDDSRNKMHEMDVLNSLQPHLNLKKLSIMEYGGLKLPCWIGDSSFCKMVDVTLINCRKCIWLPCLGQLPLLKNLRIEGMEEVKKVGVEFLGGPSLSIIAFPSLESLSFVNMPKWVNWEHSSSLQSYPHVQQLTIRNCPQLIKKLPTPLPSIIKLNIWKCPQLGIPLPSLPSLRKLDLQECNDLVVRSGIDPISLTRFTIYGISGFNRLHQGLMAFLPALEVLRISECDDEEQGLPHSLQYLEIGKCDNLEKLPNGLQNLTSLEELSIWACPKLVSFPKIDFLSMLRRLIIRDCEDLKSLPDGMMRNCNKNSSLCLLEYLEISFCPSLRCFPEGELPTTLKELHICYCENLESLPDGVMKHDSSPQHNTSGLQVLQIWRCSSLKSFLNGCFPPTLKLLQIWSCSQLELMIEKMFHDDNSLEYFRSKDAYLKSLPPQIRNLTSLTSLEIADCGNIQTSLSKWGLSRLTSLKSFSIAGIFPEVVSFSNDPDPFLLPSTLTYLSIERFKNLESLTSLALHTLTSLQHLRISGCPKLQSFLPREGLSDTVSQLYIRDCPLLSQRCIKEKGEDWPMISHIPYVEINRKFIFEQ